MARRTGRRPGKPDTREAILAAARQAFAAQGYDGASIRAIAAAARVDPALVHHYFGTKEQLFVATVQPPTDPAELIPKVVAGDPEGIGVRLVSTFLSVWEHPVSGPAFEALLRRAFASRLSARLMREFFTVRILRVVRESLADAVDPAGIPLRASLVGSQLFGLATVRYILKFEPIASAPRETVIAAVAPTIQRYLTGPLP